MSAALLRYTPPPTVERMLASSALVCGIVGPVGSGKSIGCVMKLLMTAMHQVPDARGRRRTRFAIIRNTIPMLRDTTIKSVHEWLPPGQAGDYAVTSKTFDVKFKLSDGTSVESEWMFRALDSPDDVKNLLSLELSGAWINEYREIAPDVFINLLGRVGRFPRREDGGASLPVVVCDSNPPPVGSFWHDLFERGLPEEAERAARVASGRTGALIEYFRQPSGRSPEAENVENLPPGYYENLVALNSFRGEEWVKVHVDGEYGIDPANTPVYPNFRRELHLSKTPCLVVPNRPIVLGFDFGRTPACLAAQPDARGRWRALHEWFVEGIGIEGFLDYLVPQLKMAFPTLHLQDFACPSDPAGAAPGQTDEKTCYAIMRARGFRPVAAPQDLETRVGSVRKSLDTLVDGVPMLVVDPSCKILVQGFEGGYMFARNREGELAAEPKKNRYSHLHDCLQYILGFYEGATLRGGARRKLRQADAFDKPMVHRVEDWSVFHAKN